MKRLATMIVSAALALLAPSTGFAQSNLRPGLSETFGDWQVGCQETGDDVICTMAQDVRASESSDRLLGARIDVVDPEQPARLSLIVPLGIDVSVPLELFRGAETDAFRTVQTRICQRVGCYAFVPIDGAFQDTVSGETTLRVRMVPFRGMPVDAPISLRGFEDALERLMAFRG